MSEALKSLAEQFRGADASGTKTSAMRPMGWMISGFLAATTVTSATSAPTWVSGVLLALASLLTLAYGGIYIYFAIKKPGLLRSERHNIRMEEIKLGYFGDKTTGLLERRPQQAPMMIAVNSSITEAVTVVGDDE